MKIARFNIRLFNPLRRLLQQSPGDRQGAGRAGPKESEEQKQKADKTPSTLRTQLDCNQVGQLQRGQKTVEPRRGKQKEGTTPKQAREDIF